MWVGLSTTVTAEPLLRYGREERLHNFLNSQPAQKVHDSVKNIIRSQK